MHITSLGKTSRSMPRSTSRRPKFLCTASDLTIGCPFMSAMLAWQRDRSRDGSRGWWRVESEEHPPEALEGRGWQLPLRAPAEISLEVVLPYRQDRGHQQIPDAGDNQQLQDSVRGGGNLCPASGKLSDHSGGGQGTGLQHRDGLLPSRRGDDEHRLVAHAWPHGQPTMHGHRLCR